MTFLLVTLKFVREMSKHTSTTASVGVGGTEVSVGAEVTVGGGGVLVSVAGAPPVWVSVGGAADPVAVGEPVVGVRVGVLVGVREGVRLDEAATPGDWAVAVAPAELGPPSSGVGV
jgi:hypothetical protein